MNQMDAERLKLEKGPFRRNRARQKISRRMRNTLGSARAVGENQQKKINPHQSWPTVHTSSPWRKWIDPSSPTESRGFDLCIYLFN